MRSTNDDAQKDVLFKEMSPVYYLTKNSPPLFMMAADNDTTIPAAHAYHMKKAADKLGANIELFIVKNAGHNWREAGGQIEPSADVIVQKTIDYFIKYK
jgi:dipeptidyl aminopeptidase/acylaminoacyl peptidase